MTKLQNLKKILKELQSVVVAYSGGLDSTFLLKMAVDTLGRDNVLAITARSETYPISEYREAKKIAGKIGARHLTISTEELAIKNFKANPVNRCYYCKHELFKKLRTIAKKRKMLYVLDGTNYDDLKDIRHGRLAAKEFTVRSPLLEARLTKAEIRKFSKYLSLPTWHKPSFACLASRFPFNSTITREGLTRIDRAEDYLRELGFRQVRVRDYKDTARIEFYPEDFALLLKKDVRSSLIARLKKLGFTYVTLDLEGYRTGSMHEAL